VVWIWTIVAFFLKVIFVLHNCGRVGAHSCIQTISQVLWWFLVYFVSKSWA